MDYHSNNANNGQVITSYEFQHIYTCLTSIEISTTKCAEIMKGLPGVRKIKDSFFTVPQEVAWEYFIKRYPDKITIRKISNMSELLHRAQDYAENHQDR